PGAPVDHVVQEAVARVVVVVLIAVEARLLVDVADGTLQPGLGPRAGALDGGAGPEAELVDRADVACDVEAGVLRLGDQERSLDEIELGLRPGAQVREEGEVQARAHRAGLPRKRLRRYLAVAGLGRSRGTRPGRSRASCPASGAGYF